MERMVYRDIHQIEQSTAVECTQASVKVMLDYYRQGKSLEDVRKEMPVYKRTDGVPMGTALGHAASYFTSLGFETTMHLNDVLIFDQCWKDLTSEELIENLKSRRRFVKSDRYDEDAMDAIFDGFTTFLKSGGKIVFPVIDEKYVENLLREGPVFATVNFNYLHLASRFKMVGDEFVPDPIEGYPTAHSVVISGCEDGRFLVIDPHQEYGGEKWIESGRLIGALYLAQIDLCSLLITLKK